MLLQISCSNKAEAYIASGLAMFHFFLFDHADLQFKTAANTCGCRVGYHPVLAVDRGRTPLLVSFCGLLRCRKQLTRE